MQRTSPRLYETLREQETVDISVLAGDPVVYIPGSPVVFIAGNCVACGLVAVFITGDPVMVLITGNPVMVLISSQ